MNISAELDKTQTGTMLQRLLGIPIAIVTLITYPFLESYSLSLISNTSLEKLVPMLILCSSATYVLLSIPTIYLATYTKKKYQQKNLNRISKGGLIQQLIFMPIPCLSVGLGFLFLISYPTTAKIITGMLIGLFFIPPLAQFLAISYGWYKEFGPNQNKSQLFRFGYYKLRRNL